MTPLDMVANLPVRVLLYASVLFYINWFGKMHALQGQPCLYAYEIWGISCWFCMCGIQILLNPVFVGVVPTVQKPHVGACRSFGLVWNSILCHWGESTWWRQKDQIKGSRFTRAIGIWWASCHSYTDGSFHLWCQER